MGLYRPGESGCAAEFDVKLITKELYNGAHDTVVYRAYVHGRPVREAGRKLTYEANLDGCP